MLSEQFGDLACRGLYTKRRNAHRQTFRAKGNAARVTSRGKDRNISHPDDLLCLLLDGFRRLPCGSAEQISLTIGDAKSPHR
jgi:hypothetical protein